MRSADSYPESPMRRPLLGRRVLLKMTNLPVERLSLNLSQCSMCPAIHINSRSWLRSSSTHEPSDPPLRVIFCYRHAGCGKGTPDQSHLILLRQCSSEVGSEEKTKRVYGAAKRKAL